MLMALQPVAAWLAARLPGVKVNLRSGFWPAWKSSRHPELRGTVTKAEAQQAEEAHLWARCAVFRASAESIARRRREALEGADQRLRMY